MTIPTGFKKTNVSILICSTVLSAGDSDSGEEAVSQPTSEAGSGVESQSTPATPTHLPVVASLVPTLPSRESRGLVVTSEDDDDSDLLACLHTLFSSETEGDREEGNDSDLLACLHTLFSSETEDDEDEGEEDESCSSVGGSTFGEDSQPLTSIRYLFVTDSGVPGYTTSPSFPPTIARAWSPCPRKVTHLVMTTCWLPSNGSLLATTLTMKGQVNRREGRRTRCL